MSEWVSITDRLPPPEEGSLFSVDVLVWSNVEHEVYIGYALTV